MAFMSKGLAEKNQTILVYEKEMLVVVSTIQRWRPYLIGRHFIVKIGHQSLKYLMEQRISTPSQKKWLAKLMGYDYTIMYKKGKENIVTDAPSRHP